MRDLDVFNILDSLLVAKDAGKALDLATQPPSHERAVEQATEACKVSLGFLESVPFDEFAGLGIGISLSLSQQTANLCKDVAPSLLNQLQNDIFNARMLLEGSAALLRLAANQPTAYAALDSAIQTGDSDQAITAANQLLAGSTFNDLTIENDGGFLYSSNGVTQRWSSNWQPLWAVSQNADNTNSTTFFSALRPYYH